MKTIILFARFVTQIFGALNAPLSPSYSPELALNGVKGWIPIPPRREESLIDNGVHQKPRKLQPMICRMAKKPPSRQEFEVVLFHLILDLFVEVEVFGCGLEGLGVKAVLKAFARRGLGDL